MILPSFVPALALIMGLATLSAAAAEPEQSAAAPAPSVTIVRAERGDIAEEVHVSGTITAREEVLVAPQIDGLAVTEVLVEEGDIVAKDQVLARLSRSALEAESAQAFASIAQARAQIAEAEASVLETSQALRRISSLRKTGTASAQQLEQSLSTSQVAEARLNAARQNLKVAEAQKQLVDVRMARTDIRAPAAGLVSQRNLKLGGIASLVADPAFRIIENGEVELQAEVIDSVLAKLRPGQTARVLPAGSQQPLEGTVRLISPRVDPVTRLGRVMISLPKGSAANVGSFGSGVVEIGRRTTISLPISSVTFANGRNTVQALGDDNIVATKIIETGLRAPMRIEISSGLQEGERIVARAGSFLRDGDRVTPVEVNPTEGSSK
ncbi:efflux RND transporter periplasmic adaptor subunit [Terrihabitans rhizophilus]|uniref:Efflux RND transporter periplasmic adaptor subunit n=1 Tax=Terrihabitans rhizophilus TaxID=3092662 RepID=A0ABU4RPV0_9HYPH|nr:efflux RND transporter periplasmic adaptor subunit [Terrihabitans sp. PJ23]MDX6806636.1 efflux RND transporter periplasmic adaptor subunit [Terrihabitans sp. PJ23]